MKKTPFYELLAGHGARMVEFAGYAMPIQFSSIITEHKAVRAGVGLFDVSHMAEFIIKGEKALEALEALTTNVMSTLAIGKARYTLMLNDNGGVIDDILVYRLDTQEYMIVANAANYQKDLDHIVAHIATEAEFIDITESTALLALQGKDALSIMERLFGTEALPKDNYSFTKAIYKGKELLLSRTGYTGEDGFEIFLDTTLAQDIFSRLMESSPTLCGLGARDTLRLEAGMPLYGHEMSEDTLASEIGLGWFIKTDAKDFIGKSALVTKEPQYKRIGLKVVGKGIAREGMKVFESNKEIGYVTSGTYSPTLGYPIAMARVSIDFDKDNAEIEIRGAKIQAEVCKLPFYKRQK